MTEIPWSFPRKTAINFRNETCCLRKTIYLVGKSSFKCRQSIFFPMLSVKCSGQMSFLWIQSIWPLCIYFWYVIYIITCHDTNYNTGLLYPFLKQITITKNNRIFSFLYIVFYWKNNLKLCFSLADTGVKGLLKY